jgi:uncharacterized membrane protein YoaK (UPF0700 family)
VPAHFLRSLVGTQRTVRANRRLGGTLAFVAGAVNAGGFLAIGRYTSHMTGIVSAIADDLALALWSAAAAGLVLLATFMAGAMVTAILANWARRRQLYSEFALPLMLEAVLLIVFGLLGQQLDANRTLLVPATAVVLCFLMGLQNAVVTKISKSEIRTTHMTGVVTDLGIELGRLIYRNRPDDPPDRRVVANREKIVVLSTLLACFVVGALAGALSFKSLGFAATLPFASLLVLLAIVPIADDLAGRRQAPPAD